MYAENGLVLRLRFTIVKSKCDRRNYAKRMWLVLLMLASSRLWAQGPPYQTDDPVPVDLHHYEFYIFGGVDGTPAEIDSTGPAFEFNWGAIARVQLHAILPWGGAFPSNNPVYCPAEQVQAPSVSLTWNWA